MLGCIEIQSQKSKVLKNRVCNQPDVHKMLIFAGSTASTNPHEARMDHHGRLHFASPGADRWPCRRCSTSRASWWLFSSAFALAPI